MNDDNGIDISDLPVPEKEDTPSYNKQPFTDVRPDGSPPSFMPKKTAMAAYVADQNKENASKSITNMRGIIKGVSSPLTFPADASIGAVNLIKRWAYGSDSSTLDTNASDLLEKGLDAVGLKKQEGQEWRETAYGLAGGIAGGGLKAAKPAIDAGVGNFNAWAGPAGSANRKVLNNMAARYLNVPGETRLTPEVLKSADNQAKSYLDIGRSVNNILTFHPRTAEQDLINAAYDAGYPTTAAKPFLEHPIIQRLMDTVQRGYVNGEELGNLASQLGSAAKSTISSDYTLGSALFNAKKFAENLISDGLSGVEQQYYKEGSDLYHRLHGQVLANPDHIINGDFNGQAFVNFLKSKDIRGYVLGGNKSPLYELMRRVESTTGLADGIDRQGLNHASNFMVPVVKAMKRAVPQAIQYINQQGVQPALRFAANKPGFLSALQEELNNAREKYSQGEQEE
jgi:hypothetical protein